MICVNLYPFEETVGQTDNSEAIVENIDIGGPSMLRAGAKNFRSVAVVCRKQDYLPVLDQIVEHGGLNQQTRQNLAGETFTHTAAYEAAISSWFDEFNADSTSDSP